MKGLVLHFIKNYLQLSETFIYDEIRGLKDTNSVVLTENLINKEVFPFEPILTYKNKTEVLKQLKENSIKVIHARFGEGGITIMPLAKKLGVPLITTFYGIDASRYPRYFNYRRNLRKLFRESNLLIMQSEYMKQDILKLGCPPEKVMVIYNGIDVNKFRIKKYIETDTVNISMCGRIVEKKGMEYGIKAYERLRNKNTRLLIIGDGKLKNNLELLVKSLNIENKVTFYGFSSHTKVSKLLHNTDIFLAPHITSSNGDKEGIPNTIKEAMATGIPIVSTYHAGISELVTENENGFLVPEKDIQGLQEKLDWLIEHREVWQTFGTKGRKIVEEKFNLSKQIEELEKIYNNICS